MKQILYIYGLCLTISCTVASETGFAVEGGNLKGATLSTGKDNPEIEASLRESVRLEEERLSKKKIFNRRSIFVPVRDGITSIRNFFIGK